MRIIIDYNSQVLPSNNVYIKSFSLFLILRHSFRAKCENQGCGLPYMGTTSQLLSVTQAIFQVVYRLAFGLRQDGRYGE